MYFRPISLQWEVGPKQHPEDADGSVTPSTEPQTFAFVKIDLGSGYPLVLANRLLHSLYIQAAGYNIIGERGNPCPKRASKRDTEQGFQSEDIEMGRQGCRPAELNARSRTPSNTFWGCPRGVLVKAMDCGIVVHEFVLQSRYYVHFRANTLGKGMNPLILPPTMGK